MNRIINKWTESSLILKIVIGLIIGSILGVFVPNWTIIGFPGEIFVSALKAIAPILVFVLVASAISKARTGIGSRFKTVIILYLFSTFLSAMVAIIASTLFPVTIHLSDASTAAAPGGLGEVMSNMILGIFANPIGLISEGHYLGILFWSIVFGIALKNIASDSTKDVVTDCANAVTLIVGCIAFVAFVTDPIISAVALRRNPYPLVLTCLRESGITAFFTRSSAANIPVNMQLCERLGLDRDFFSISIPLGATINMEGAAVTITVMTLAVCHTMGISVPLPVTVVLCIISTVGACGASGVAGGSLLLIPMACSLFGIPADVSMQAVAVGFIIGVIQDSCETALNSAGDALFSATAEYHDRRVNGEPVNFLGEFAK